ncbi:MAG: sn-glycerol-3-phosphate ABC transporter ATP-binding protein UgpC [Erysipelotrichia bacterium]|jgi:multiple sugar transport system ATP-binding protein|nr:sn-glycerol-3-phosphate ABC transporter ATP-binding protein UgpC [Erysipelotrichia bacterium]
MSQVSLRHVYKVYEGGVRAVKDFSLDIKDKEFIVFVGPSGCGKSTTLRMIAGLEEITAGQLYIDNVYVNDKESKDRDIAMVFQNYALYPHMTVYQNMAFGLKLRKFDPEDIDRRVKRAAEILEITDLLTRKPKALSGGQRQRVALGRAIVREPSVFLLDEPLSNLDAKLRVQMRTEITKLHNRLATTFIYVTHDQTEAMTMGTRIVVMKDGVIQQVDTPITLFENPTNLFVATFLGSPQMNILKSKLTLEKNSLVAYLNGDETMKAVFKENKKRQLSSFDYINQEVLLGIRPENIAICEKGMDAYVDVVEQLGDETLIYAKIKGREEYLIIKSTSADRIKAKQNIKVQFDVDRIHLFDCKTEKAIMGIPSENRFTGKIENHELVFGKNRWQLSDEYLNHLVDRAFKEEIVIAFKPEDVVLGKIPDAHQVVARIDFVEEKSDYVACYGRINGFDNYLVFKVRIDDNIEIKSDDEVTLSIPKESVTIYQENERLLLKEKSNTNEAPCHISFKDEKMVVAFGKNNLILNPIPGVEAGEHRFKIKQDGAKVSFTKKMIKKYKLNRGDYAKQQLIKVSAYDEDKTGEKNAIFVKIDGFEGYVTLVVENNFTVYEMPEFEIYLDENSLAII